MVTVAEYFALKSWLKPWEVEARIKRINGWNYIYPCDLCGVTPHKPFMVTGDVWRKSGISHELIVCRPCFEKKLGRALTIYDLSDCSLSDWLFLELLNNVCNEEIGDGVPAALRTFISQIPSGRAKSMEIPGGWERFISSPGTGSTRTRSNGRRSTTG